MSEAGAAFDDYMELAPIRSRGSFHLLAARRRSDGDAVVLVISAPSADAGTAEAALERAAAAHAAIDHPRVPRTSFAGRRGGRFVLALHADASIDGVDFLRVVSDQQRKVPYGVADTILTGVRQACQAAHRVGQFIGRLSYANVLFAPSGRWYVVGFGHNFVCERENGSIVGWTPVFGAPEVALGAAPTPETDYVAMLMLGRSLTNYLELPPMLAAVLAGRPTASSALVEALRWFHQRLLGELPAGRATVEEAIRMSERVRAMLATKLAPEEAERFVREVIARENEAPPSVAIDAGPGSELSIGPDAEWIAVGDGTRHRIAGRPALRRIVIALVRSHEAGNGAPLSAWELFEAGWPGESPIYEAALNRVYVTINRLRALGLRHAIERIDDGYRFARGLRVRLGDPRLLSDPESASTGSGRDIS